MGTLEAAGYEPVVQEFEWDFEETATPEFDLVAPSPPAPKVYVQSTDGIEGDFATMDYSGSGEVTEPIVPTNDIVIPPGNQASTSDSGCEEDFADADFTGAIAPIQRGTCDFIVKAMNAEAPARWASSSSTRGSPVGRQPAAWHPRRPGVTIPVIGTSFAVGEELLNSPRPARRSSTSSRRPSRSRGRPSTSSRTWAAVRSASSSWVPTWMVVAGPGINDSGSGSGMILEIAEAMAELEIAPHGPLRVVGGGGVGSRRLRALRHDPVLERAQQDR